jgi:hypothetical protein
VLNNIISLLFLMNQFLWISWTMSNHEIQNSQGWFRDMMFNATFNNISVISWRLVLLVKETGVPRENHRPVASHWQTLSHNAEFTNIFLNIYVMTLAEDTRIYVSLTVREMHEKNPRKLESTKLNELTYISYILLRN